MLTSKVNAGDVAPKAGPPKNDSSPSDWQKNGSERYTTKRREDHRQPEACVRFRGVPGRLISLELEVNRPHIDVLNNSSRCRCRVSCLPRVCSAGPASSAAKGFKQARLIGRYSLPLTPQQSRAGRGDPRVPFRPYLPGSVVGEWSMRPGE